MQELKVETKLVVFDSINELNAQEQKWMLKAIEARKKAYAPYSNFQVGAALVLDNQEVLEGSNQENAAYPSGLCAERVVIFYAGANYPSNKVTKIFISASSTEKETITPIPPCGACRQSIAEYEIKQDSNIEIYFMGAKGAVYKSHSLKNLLPFLFDKANL